MALKDRYLTVSQAAKELGVTRQTIYRWIANAKIPAEKIGKAILIEKEQIEKLYVTKKAAEEFVKNITDYIREKYGYTDDEIPDLIDVHGFETYWFQVTRADGTYDIVEVEIGKVEELKREKDDPFLLFGMKAPIVRIKKQQFRAKSNQKKQASEEEGGA